MFEFALPDVGEGLTEAEIVTWHVVVGESVEINDTLVEIETAKSIVELPSPAAGTIVAVHVDTGTTVDVGTVLISIEDGVSAPVAPPPPTAEREEEPLVLVGKAPTDAAPRRRRLRAREDGAPAVATAVVPPPERTSAGRGRTKPPVRLLAKQLGVDLSTVTPSSGDLITRGDVEAAATGGQPVAQVPATGRETRVPIKGVRKATAAAMTRSAFTAPHVTEWLTVDVTRTMDMVRRLKADRAWNGVRLTPLVFVARAFLLAIRRFPDINARWDEDAQEIVLQHYVNLGIAAATPRGLMVPNIKDSHTLDLAGLAHALDDLVQTARAGRTSPEQMSHGTVTITNIGALGVDAGTPILNPGESAILAFGAVREMPWVVDGEVVVRQVTQLAMSFDHRLVDGELGSNVLAEVGRLLSDPGETFLYV
ncbi:dihydrolipoamide acetyltransferase family protein [Aeromicrobium chenweiae]|uniref:Dihydrolipoamide acetyltransferase component of pyruvate dehydrogenase complex n=1 Tax=Aeromicrobium chenweiae TaxID=2079793 RepID=A0A2S0WHU5_9ACTN|nr:dihydrolipoamide acetyltransferase family protein [Aeromicrobium chenweiae]AWB90915.1 branched-chain alpha-keto acid dehydrogenase subunit E2 [Aeromicrobium chenweiae]TGN32134.1 2-oxo acid dehydrogenase subunit E2 [Aeromicrobium chenweiae]